MSVAGRLGGRRRRCLGSRRIGLGVYAGTGMILLAAGRRTAAGAPLGMVDYYFRGRVAVRGSIGMQGTVRIAGWLRQERTSYVQGSNNFV